MNKANVNRCLRWLEGYAHALGKTWSIPAAENYGEVLADLGDVEGVMAVRKLVFERDEWPNFSSLRREAEQFRVRRPLRKEMFPPDRRYLGASEGGHQSAREGFVAAYRAEHEGQEPPEEVLHNFDRILDRIRREREEAPPPPPRANGEIVRRLPRAPAPALSREERGLALPPEERRRIEEEVRAAAAHAVAVRQARFGS